MPNLELFEAAAFEADALDGSAPDSIVYMPQGQHTISGSVNGKPESACQILALPSQDAVAMRYPSGLNST